MLSLSVQRYFDALDIKTISPERRAVLDEIQIYVQTKIAENRPVSLTFICTHNSRRSHFGQVWAQVAAHEYGIAEVLCFSGGTETTACNPRTVVALERAGLVIEKKSENENPVYELIYAKSTSPILAFSKRYDQAPNPVKDFVAVVTCSQAEQNCPYIPGAERRFALLYDDPKETDGTPRESKVYDERCRQIATEIKYLFSGLS